MVYYNGATHGSWCNTETQPMICRYCRERVFYFPCDCGCKVFFEDLGHPWTEHNCPQRQEALDADVKRVIRNWVRKLGIEGTAEYLDIEISEVKNALD